jgi:hypothetical protein
VNKINIFTLMMDLGTKVAEFGTGSNYSAPLLEWLKRSDFVRPSVYYDYKGV